MADLVAVAVLIGFFVLMAGFVRAGDRVVGGAISPNPDGAGSDEVIR